MATSNKTSLNPSDSITIVTHEMLYGASQALRDYLNKQKIYNVSYVGLPLLIQRKAKYMYYRDGKLVKNKTINIPFSLGIIEYIVDILITLYWIFTSDKSKIYVGVNCLNCIAGFIGKKFGRIEKVIFYGIDFVPIRFNNKILNNLYHYIEVFCVKNSDEVWNVSPRIADGRKKFLHLDQNKYPQKVVQIGIWLNEFKFENKPTNNLQQIVFVGHLLKKQGVQLAISSMNIVKKKLPTVKLLIIGGGPYENVLKKQVKDLGLSNSVEFLGWVKNKKLLHELLRNSSIAIAPYKPEKERLYNFTYYADPTKLKDYLASGLPIILTNVSYNALDIQNKKCGIVVQYKVEDIANAMIRLLENKNLLNLYRRNAIKLSNRYDWSKIFAEVFI